MKLFRHAVSFVLLTVMFCLCPLSCTKHFSPCGSGDIPDVSQTEELLKKHVFHLTDTIGERNAYRAGTMEASANYIETQLKEMGYIVTRQEVSIPPLKKFGAVKDRIVYNVVAVKKGISPSAKMLVVETHYDTKVGMDSWNAHGPARPERIGTPGANDNASGTAALLETARALAATPVLNDVCLVAYANEEPPFSPRHHRWEAWFMLVLWRKIRAKKRSSV